MCALCLGSKEGFAFDLCRLIMGGVSKMKCPRCGKHGSLHRKWVLNKVKRRYFPYYYVAHYNPQNKGVKWCYVSREIAKEFN